MALDPETGETLWMYRLEEGIRWQKAPRQFAGRGPSYWTDGRNSGAV
jgi:quinoprotein glucose dehydrogenase